MKTSVLLVWLLIIFSIITASICIVMLLRIWRKKEEPKRNRLANSIQLMNVPINDQQIKIILAQYEISTEAVKTLTNHLLATFFGIFLSFASLSSIALQGVGKGLPWARYIIIGNYLLILIFYLFYIYSYKRIQFYQEMLQLIEDHCSFDFKVCVMYNKRKKSWGIARSKYLAIAISLQLFITNTILLYFFLLIN